MQTETHLLRQVQAGEVGNEEPADEGSGQRHRPRDPELDAAANVVEPHRDRNAGDLHSQDGIIQIKSGWIDPGLHGDSYQQGRPSEINHYLATSAQVANAERLLSSDEQDTMGADDPHSLTPVSTA